MFHQNKNQSWDRSRRHDIIIQPKFNREEREAVFLKEKERNQGVISCQLCMDGAKKTTSKDNLEAFE